MKICKSCIHRKGIKRFRTKYPQVVWEVNFTIPKKSHWDAPVDKNIIIQRQINALLPITSQKYYCEKCKIGICSDRYLMWKRIEI